MSDSWTGVRRISVASFLMADSIRSKTNSDPSHFRRVARAIIHFAIAPRYLGLEVVIAKSFTRIHWQNLVNFGVLPLTYAIPDDYDRLKQGTTIRIARVADALRAGQDIKAEIAKGGTITLRHTLSKSQIAGLSIRAGSASS